MASEKRIGDIRLYLTDELFNSLASVMYSFEKVASDNVYGQYAEKIKNSMMRFGREYTKNEIQSVNLNFYPEEAAMIIKLLVMYINAIEEPSEDFFSEFHDSKL